MTKPGRFHSPPEDDDLAGIDELPTLKSIGLRNTRITDGAIKYLEPIKTLESVNLMNTAVTAEGIERLEKAIPNVVISR